MNQMRADISRIQHAYKMYDTYVAAHGYKVVEDRSRRLIQDIKNLNWWTVLNLTTPKLKATYNKLQVAIQQLEEKIKSGI